MLRVISDWLENFLALENVEHEKFNFIELVYENYQRNGKSDEDKPFPDFQLTNEQLFWFSLIHSTCNRGRVGMRSFFLESLLFVFVVAFCFSILTRAFCFYLQNLIAFLRLSMNFSRQRNNFTRVSTVLKYEDEILDELRQIRRVRISRYFWKFLEWKLSPISGINRLNII